MSENCHDFCSQCIYPVGSNIKNPLTGELLTFTTFRGRVVCELCAEMLAPGGFPSRGHFDAELEQYFQTHNRILFAYSGGLDSTAVLVHLATECRKRGIALELFTVQTGAKGKVTRRNIERVIDCLGLRSQHFYVDIESTRQDDPRLVRLIGESRITPSVYKRCWELGILPCGKICNMMMDAAYQSVLESRGYQELLTGGDTPKRGQEGQYSLFWRKASGLVVVRGGYAFQLSKVGNRQLLQRKRIPWCHPRCGGYDTDCLVPGAFLREQLNGRRGINLDRLVREFPVIVDYLAERVRFGVIRRHDALRKMASIDIASPASYRELCEVFRTVP